MKVKKMYTTEQQKRWDSFKCPKGYKEVFPSSPMNWKLINGRKIIFEEGFGHCIEKRTDFNSGLLDGYKFLEELEKKTKPYEKKMKHVTEKFKKECQQIKNRKI